MTSPVGLDWWRYGKRRWWRHHKVRKKIRFRLISVPFEINSHLTWALSFVIWYRSTKTSSSDEFGATRNSLVTNWISPKAENRNKYTYIYFKLKLLGCFLYPWGNWFWQNWKHLQQIYFPLCHTSSLIAD